MDIVHFIHLSDAVASDISVGFSTNCSPMHSTRTEWILIKNLYDFQKHLVQKFENWLSKSFGIAIALFCKCSPLACNST